MDEIRENLTCLRVAELRGSGEALPVELESHASSCPNCLAVREVDEVLGHYEPPRMPHYSRERLWERIEQRGSSSSAVWLRYAVAAVLAFVAWISLYYGHPTRPQEARTNETPVVAQKPILVASLCSVSEIKGNVYLRSLGETPWRALHLQDQLTGGTAIKVASGSAVRFSFPGKTEIALQGDSEGTIQTIFSDRKGLDSFYLLHGKVYIHHRDNPFMASTPVALIEAVGTEFSVRHEGKDTEVRVFRGRVHVKSLKQETSMGREQHLWVGSRADFKVQPFSMKEAEPWERSEFKLAYLNHGKMIQSTIKLVKHTNAVRSSEENLPELRNNTENKAELLTKHQEQHEKSVNQKQSQKLEERATNYHGHLERLRDKEEDQMKKYDEEQRKKAEELLKEQEAHEKK